jgi:hypothetical protein
VGVLFVDKADAKDTPNNNLFKINQLGVDGNVSIYDTNRGFSGIVRFPRNIGLTGESI